MGDFYKIGKCRAPKEVVKWRHILEEVDEGNIGYQQDF